MFTLRVVSLSFFLLSVLIVMAGCRDDDISSEKPPTTRTYKKQAGKSKGETFSMKQYAWKNRPLLVFAPSAEDSRYLKQRELIEGAEEAFRDREMIWIEIFSSDDTSKANEKALTQQDADQLRQKFGVGKNTFTVILVGKDTSVKRRSQEPISAKTLFEQIDRMPMRRQEMKRRSSDGNEENR